MPIVFPDRAAAVLSLVASFLLAGGTQAQGTEGTSVEAVRTAQYLLLIDDSGSMSRSTKDGPSADSDRLAVFAVDSLMSLLDDSDEATVLRLGATADNEGPLPLASLATNRSNVRAALALDGKLAAYNAGNTDCAGGLAQASNTLNAAYRRGVPQVMIFLTDGACNTGEINTAAFLSTVKSYSEEKNFKFYLLTFAGRPSTGQLADLSRTTGGEKFSVTGDDPTEILEPFAKAVSRSQGYDAFVLTPSDTRLSAHKAARRVRLLAVAPGEGIALGMSLEANGPGTLPILEAGKTVTGTHRFKDGRPFRFVRAEYRPAGAAVKVSVNAGGASWKAIALPEYRLRLNTEVTAGACEQRGAPIESIDVGGHACVTVSLTNENGTVLDAIDLGSRPEIGVAYAAPGTAPTDLPAAPSGSQLTTSLTRRNLVGGDHVFRPYAVFSLGGAQARIQGQPRTLQASSRQVLLEPRILTVGDILPGAAFIKSVTPGGAFPATNTRVTLNPPDSLPKCVKIVVAGVPLGQPFAFAAGNPLDIRVDVEGYCGPANIERALTSSLRFEFDSSSGLPARELPLDGRVMYRISVPPVLQVVVDGGKYAAADFVVTTSASQPTKIPLRILRDANWPDADLALGFPSEEGRVLEKDGTPVSEGQVDSGRARLVAYADACCSAGEHTTRVAFGVEGGDPPLYVPVKITVTGASLWACNGRRIIYGASGLLGVLLLAGIIRMIRHTHMINPKELRIRPMYREDGTGEPKPESTRKIEDVVTQLALALRKRSWPRAWWSVKPFYTMIRGDYYHTVQIELSAKKAEIDSVSEVTTRELYQRVKAAGDQKTRSDSGVDERSLYVSATEGGAVCWAVVHDDFKIRQFKVSKPGLVAPTSKTTKVVELRGGARLVVGVDPNASESGRRHAGWIVG